jgi:hypothetical protein
MNCKSKENFHLEELVSDIEKTNLSEKEQILFKFFQRDTEDVIIERMRDLYYFYGPRNYDDWLDDEMCARQFWCDVKDAAEEDEWTLKIKLTPDDREALEDARLGNIGRELFASIVTWFFDHGFIRTDITVWNCRIFRYLDSYLITKENIILGVFRHYEDIRDIEGINEEIIECLKKYIPSRMLRILEAKIDADERRFENDSEEISLTDQEKEVIRVTNEYLKPLADGVYRIIFEA